MKQKYSLISLFLLVCFSFGNIQAQEVQFASNPIVAHRGAWKKKNLPQNSIASLKEAIALQCTGSEFDVKMTADDSLIIVHDSHYNNLQIETSDYQQLSEFSLANGEKLPTLRQYILAGMHNNTSTRLVCEIKPSDISKERGKLIASKVVKLVEDLNAKAWVEYISFDYGILKTITELDAKAITFYLDGTKSPDELKADNISGADYHYSVFKRQPEWIDKAKEHSILLNAWTVNTAAEMDYFLIKGFEFITTDEPELLIQRIHYELPVGDTTK